MRILTVGECPYILSKAARMHSDLLRNLVSNHEVKSVVWNLDVTWFAPEEDGKYYYEHKEEKITEMCLLPPSSAQGTAILYEHIKQFQPDLVISISTYEESAGVFAAKSLEPDSFKWLPIFFVDSNPINEAYFDLFKTADFNIFTNKEAWSQVKDIDGVLSKYVPYGPNHDSFFNIEDVIPDKNSLRVMNCSKNAQTSNISSFIHGMSKIENENINGYLHTNYSSPGEYHLDLLINRYNVSEKISLPQEFVSINDGPLDEDLNIEYNKSDIILDTSVRAATGLSVLEGMAAGCIPIVTKVGALKEIVERFPEEYQFFVRSVIYIGDNEKEYHIIDPNDLAKKISYLYELKINNKKEFEKIKCNVIKEAQKISSHSFVKRIEEIVEEIKDINGTMFVEVI